MLPGFSNNTNDQFMAVEGFTSSGHNRSDEAFTVADLDKFRKENNFAGDQHFESSDIPMLGNGSSERFADDDLTTTSTNTRTSKTEADIIDDETSITSNTMNTKKTTTTKASKKKNNSTTTKPSVTKKPTTTAKTESDNMTTQNNKKETKTTTTITKTLVNKKPTTTKMSLNTDNEPFAELDVNTSAEDEEDVLNPEEDEAAEEEIDDTSDLITESFTNAKNSNTIEGFTGSLSENASALHKFLLALLLAFIVFVLIQPKTAKLLGNISSGLYKFKEIVLAVVALLVFYVILLVL